MSDDNRATVVSGNDKLKLESLVGQSVADIEDRYADDLHIPEDASILVNGREVDSSYTLKAGDQLVFSKPTGSKG